jgi:AraC family transcriptional regulator of adaptative response / DNA-3-methyladenine glycosylase II
LYSEREFNLTLPAGYPLRQALAYLGRDPANPTCRVAGREVALALTLGGAPALVRLTFGAGSVGCTLEASGKLPEDAAVSAHGQLLRLLGLDRSPEAFERSAAAAPDGARLIAGRRGLRLLGTPSPFDGLVWTIVGQQVNLPFAFALRRRLVERAGAVVGEGLTCLPSPQAVANLTVDELARLQFSRRKAEYLIGAARLVAAGELRLEELARGSATRAEGALLAVRGLGRWSANYLLLRSFGYEDCVPLGDSGLARGLTRFYGLAERPGERETLDLMAPFAPFRSWATLHLWQSLGDEA